MDSLHPFTPEGMLTLAQALQLVGLVPCLFLIFFLLVLAPRNGQTLIPVFYFLALAAGFLWPLVTIYPDISRNPWFMGALRFLESLLPAFGFLLILQFLKGATPRWPYWLVLMVPLAGSVLIYANVLTPGAVCDSCAENASIESLYDTFGAAFIFLLLVYYISRNDAVVADYHKTHKYWLILALVLLHLCLLAAGLAHMAGAMTQEKADLVTTLLRLAFIYLVITSLFRVFYPALAIDAVSLATDGRRYDPVADLPHVEKLQALLATGVYREMRLNRARLAEKVGIGEHHLSRVINGHWQQSFSELLNGYRIEEAKRRLVNEPTAITTIAFETGFNSIASFNRVFKESTGMSPTEFRLAPL